MRFKMKYLVTDLYSDFSCIGGTCSNTCCQNWSIVIDEETMEKYRQLDEPVRSMILNKIVETECGYEIVKEENGRCPFLTEKNLCQLYLQVSPDILSETCKTFPRKAAAYGNTIMATVSLACPEVVRMVLERKEPIQFVFAEQGEERVSMGTEGAYYNALLQGLVVTTQLLQNRQFSMWQRLQLVVTLSMELQTAFSASDFEKIYSISEQYKDVHYCKEVLQQQNISEVVPDGCLNLIISIFNLLENGQGLERKSQELLKNIHVFSQEDEQKYRMWSEDFAKQEQDVEWEHLAVQLTFEYYMDVLKGNSITVNVVKMLIFLIIARVLEVIEFQKNKRLILEQKRDLIAQVSRMLEHSKALELVATYIVDGNSTEQLFQLLYCLK